VIERSLIPACVSYAGIDAPLGGAGGGTRPPTACAAGTSIQCAYQFRHARTWWAWRDLNPQPDRYERPALTIERQAPPSAHLQRITCVFPDTGTLT
jgi:hypothetical protein